MPALAAALLSPDTQVFSTPPTSPISMDDHHDYEPEIQPSLSRRSSRPSNLLIDHVQSAWNSDIILEEQSPRVLPSGRLQPIPRATTPRPSKPAPANGSHLDPSHPPAANGNGFAPPITMTSPDPRPALASPSTFQHTPRSHQNPMSSPCFVHSHLDKGASFTEWLKQRHGIAPDVGVARGLQHSATPAPEPAAPRPRRYRKLENGQVIPVPYDDGSVSDSYAVDAEYEEIDDDETGGSLTKQLAETAVGVREMSKQLGRARIKSHVQNVLIVTKARDNRLIQLTRELAVYLMTKKRHGGRGLVVYVDHQLRTSRRFDAAGIERDHPELFIPFPRRRTSSNNSFSSSTTSLSMSSMSESGPNEDGQLRYWTAEMCNRSPHLFDFVVTLGGDGTVLFTSWLFQRIVPPVLPFALGSLGFLTNFDFADHQAVMDSAIESGIRVNLRMRFTCTVYRAVPADELRRAGKGRRKAVKKGETGEIMMRNLEKGGWEALEGGWHAHEKEREGGRAQKDKEIMCFTTRPVESFEVINDLVVDRGPSPYVSMLELFGDEHHMTTVQGDGLTISTPTGSTAYSASAGGSLVHPEIPAILITPICPHTLSFRPMLLPDTMEVRICVPFNSRSTAWASFDGRGRVELKQGDHIKVTASKYPFPTVCADKQSTDWFHAISRTLKWNERERQKSFVVVEEGPVKARSKKEREHTSSSSEATVLAKQAGDQDEEDEVSDEEDSSSEEEDEEEEKFDIDDLSPEGTPPDAKKPSDSTLETAQRKALAEQQRQPPHDTLEAQRAAEALMGLSVEDGRAQARSKSGIRSGVDSPDRFAGPHPHPRRLSPRHVEFASPAGVSASSSTASLDWAPGAHGGHGGHGGGGEGAGVGGGVGGVGGMSGISHVLSRGARDEMRTPTASEHAAGKRKARSRSRGRYVEEAPPVQPRAFAVWGQDESDSNASDSDT